MKFQFPPHFDFGTSTCAYQIETAVDHDWTGHLSKDGHRFNRTTDHELRHEEDVQIIAGLAPNYRMGLMWSKLQHAPYAELDKSAVREYLSLLKALRSKNVKIMMVIHHFANPVWFAETGGWENHKSIAVWVDYAKKIIDTFGQYVESWNTFNEPNAYATMGWLIGEFPPHRINFLLARRVIRNMAEAHHEIFRYIKRKNSNAQVGISHNCIVAAPQNLMGVIPAKLFDAWFMKYTASLFRDVDFWGLSYYARICFDPLPITNVSTPEKMKQLGKRHDDMWEYYPEGIKENIQRFWHKFRKPIIITENGICTSDDSFRIEAVKDYLRQIKECLDDGIDVRGYYHWTAWDNFEWSLGPTYRFGLYECDLTTKDRRRKPSADVYSQLAHTKEIDFK
jgi:beta-glucosidase